MSILPKPSRPTLIPGGRSAKRSTVKAPPKQTSRIAYDTRMFVWQRDGGRCAHCGATQELQFDHIVPESLGGSGEAQNVELLCGGCNNRKKARLFTPS